MVDLPEGFVPHDGGPCPVPLSSLIEVMLANGEVWTMKASYWLPSRWSGKRGPNQPRKLPPKIIAYRLTQQEPKP